MAISPEFAKRFEFDWEILDVILGSQSAIDSGKRLTLRSSEEISRFMDCYGYDIENPIEKAELFGNFQEALNFIRRYFLYPDNPEGLRIEVPRKIAELNDIPQLLAFASVPLSSPGQAQVALWSCALMKVMHTIAHMDKDLRTNYYTDIQTQILDRFYRFIHTDENDQLYLGKDARDPDRVDLVLFESKPKKSRDSVLLKLLHKSENVAEDIFDRVGIRFVTKMKFDALRVVKYMKERNALMPANIKPSRTRNSLIDQVAFEAELSKLLKFADTGEIAPLEVQKRITEFCESDQAAPESERKAQLEAQTSANPHSSSHYRAIQFTCRQLIKIKNPLYDDLKVLKAALKKTSLSEEITKINDRIDLANLQKEIRFFYPFEVQILDERSHRENLAGRSSHANYKKSQVQTAMKRVMGELARFSEGEPSASH